MRISCLLLLVAFLGAAEPAQPDELDMTALKALLSQATEAFNRQDTAAMEQVLAPDYTVVMADQRLATDRAGLQAGVDRWCTGASAPFTSIEFKPTVDRHAKTLAVGTAVASGASKDSYHFKTGKVVEVDSRWTATMVKTPAGWRIAQLHLGIDPVDNPMMREVAGQLGLFACLGAGAGLLVGALVGWLIGRRRRA